MSYVMGVCVCFLKTKILNFIDCHQTEQAVGGVTGLCWVGWRECIGSLGSVRYDAVGITDKR